MYREEKWEEGRGEEGQRCSGCTSIVRTAEQHGSEWDVVYWIVWYGTAYDGMQCRAHATAAAAVLYIIRQLQEQLQLRLALCTAGLALSLSLSRSISYPI